MRNLKLINNRWKFVLHKTDDTGWAINVCTFVTGIKWEINIVFRNKCLFKLKRTKWTISFQNYSVQVAINLPLAFLKLLFSSIYTPDMLPTSSQNVSLIELLFFVHSHKHFKKKSAGDRSGFRGGHRLSPLCEISLLGTVL